MGSFIDDLSDIIADHENNVSTGNYVTPKAKAETFPCESCGGTGFYRGARVQQMKTHCFACKGKGYFKLSYADRLKARKSTQDRKARFVNEAKDLFLADNAAILARMIEIQSWNSFAQSLVEQFNSKGFWSENQIAAAHRIDAKIAATTEIRNTEKAEKSGTVDMTAIEKMFETAVGNGLKRPKFVAEGLKISLAPATGANAGALYIVRDDVYQGKVKGGEFMAVSSAQADTVNILIEIAKNPSESARMYGKRTGMCCCCSRELTDSISIEMGIGPICAKKWQL